MGAKLPKQRIGAGVRPREHRPTTTDGPVKIIGASWQRKQSSKQFLQLTEQTR
jgi:hypothetical protein